MKLRYSPFSPYARKVAVVAIEVGLDARLDRINTIPNDAAGDLKKDNPLGKVPVLLTDDGEALYDSPVICEYLDSHAMGAKVFPEAGRERWRALRLQALADGVMDAALLCREESRRPPDRQYPDWVSRQKSKVNQALDDLEKRVGELDGKLTIGQIAVGCALGYLDFRFAADDWRKARPKLAKWYESFARRPSMLTTRHQG